MKSEAAKYLIATLLFLAHPSAKAILAPGEPKDQSARETCEREYDQALRARGFKQNQGLPPRVLEEVQSILLRCWARFSEPAPRLNYLRPGGRVMKIAENAYRFSTEDLQESFEIALDMSAKRPGGYVSFENEVAVEIWTRLIELYSGPNKKDESMFINAHPEDYAMGVYAKGISCIRYGENRAPICSFYLRPDGTTTATELLWPRPRAGSGN